MISAAQTSESAAQPMATMRQSLYKGSSQYRHWRFSPEQLAATRSSLNAAAVKAIRDAFEADSVRTLLLLIDPRISSGSPLALTARIFEFSVIFESR
jgi:hypothetical protein